MLNDASDSKFATRSWNIVNDQSNANYSVENEIIYSTEELNSSLCNYNDAYTLVRGDYAIIGQNITQETFKNCTTFIKCIT